MSYTSFDGFDGNPRKKETWLMLRQAFEERGIDIARPEKYSIVQERMFTQMKNGIDKLPAYKWQDGAIVEAEHNDDADYEFRKITHGSALGKEQKLEYFANACKKELCERTLQKKYKNELIAFTATYHDDYIERYFDTANQTYNFANASETPFDLYVIWEYKFDYYLYQRPSIYSSPQIVYQEKDQPFNGRVMNGMVPNTLYFLGRVEASGNLAINYQVGDYIYTDASQYITDDEMVKRKFYVYATPTFYFDYDFVMK